MARNAKAEKRVNSLSKLVRNGRVFLFGWCAAFVTSNAVASKSTSIVIDVSTSITINNKV